MKTLEDLLEHQLKDLYNAENQLIKALPKMVEAATDKKLKKAFEDHLEETKIHKTRLEEACKQLDFDPKGETCKAMEGLIKEAEGFLKEDATDEVRDAGLIAEAQRIEHYEISGYGTVLNYLKALKHKEAANILMETLNEEQTADTKLNDLAIGTINKKAIA